MNKIQNEKWVNALPDEALCIAEEINIEIAKVIAERIKTIGELSPSDVKKLTNSLEYLGSDFKKITKLIAKYSSKGQMAVVDMLKEVADANDEFANVFYSAKGIAAHTWHNDKYLNNLVESMARQTAAEFKNLSQTLAYKIDDRTLTLRQMYSRAIDKAIYEVQSGTVDYHTAMRKTVKQLAIGLRSKDSAITVNSETGEVKLIWESGHSRRLDSHVRQNLIDGIKQLQGQILDYHGEQFGSDGVELSAHAISAPDHVTVQGRQFSNEEFFKMQTAQNFQDVKGNKYEGFSRPIGQWNCRHVHFPIVIGISEPVYSEEQLKEFAENSEKKYDLTQQQRAMETKLRSLKTQRIAASSAGDELEAKRLQRKINEQQTIYRRFSEKHNLLYDTKRASIEGYRRISVDKPDYLRNNLPKHYKDERLIGEKISQSDLNQIIEYAKSKDVQIGSLNNPTGGFERYRGNIKILRELINEISIQQQKELFIGSKIRKPALYYGYILGYDGDRSKIDVNAFAETTGRTITLNKFMFDDSEHLMREYAVAEKQHYFVKGSNYKHIIPHEIGHIINKGNKALIVKIIAVLEETANKQNLSLDDFIKNHISSYAADKNIDGSYCELLPEINSLLKLNENNDIIKLLKNKEVL